MLSRGKDLANLASGKIQVDSFRPEIYIRLGRKELDLFAGPGTAVTGNRYHKSTYHSFTVNSFLLLIPFYC